MTFDAFDVVSFLLAIGIVCILYLILVLNGKI